MLFFKSKPQNSIKILPTIEKVHKSHKNRPTSSESIQSQRVDSSHSLSKIAERVDSTIHRIDPPLLKTPKTDRINTGCPRSRKEDTTHLLEPMPFLLSQGLLRYGLAIPFKDLWYTLYDDTQVHVRIRAVIQTVNYSNNKISCNRLKNLNEIQKIHCAFQSLFWSKNQFIDSGKFFISINLRTL
jgi:hypothetical protein